MTWNQATIERLAEQGYGPKDPEWRNALYELAEHTPEPDWDQMRADLGIRRDPIMEILDEPNMPMPKLGGPEFDRSPLTAWSDLNALVKVTVTTVDALGKTITRVMDCVNGVFSIDNLGSGSYRCVLVDPSPPQSMSPYGITTGRPVEPDRKTLDRVRMRKHVATERRKQRAKR